MNIYEKLDQLYSRVANPLNVSPSDVSYFIELCSNSDENTFIPKNLDRWEIVDLYEEISGVRDNPNYTGFLPLRPALIDILSSFEKLKQQEKEDFVTYCVVANKDFTDFNCSVFKNSNELSNKHFLSSVVHYEMFIYALKAVLLQELKSDFEFEPEIINKNPYPEIFTGTDDFNSRLFKKFVNNNNASSLYNLVSYAYQRMTSEKENRIKRTTHIYFDEFIRRKKLINPDEEYIRRFDGKNGYISLDKAKGKKKESENRIVQSYRQTLEKLKDTR